MNPAHPIRPAHSGSDIGRERLLLSLALAALLLLVVILGSFHHHHDLTAHPDCPVCAFVHHADVTAPPGPVLTAISLPVLPVLFVLLVSTPPAVGPRFLLGSRAPPR